ncbi:hypothetical protein BDV95DRAFT_605283 [Massariosphaeria phaeospora]|uniref:Uncharacterized protein n=1 Tax=Massariosphaeria phaeospora TaxID=100035 RepID=A0A7C8IBC6_9PLEO|nr:hypothetical protein BDV95DRAFT_605283 [Massariosphaeria phaeospora]
MPEYSGPAANIRHVDLSILLAIPEMQPLVTKILNLVNEALVADNIQIQAGDTMKPSSILSTTEGDEAVPTMTEEGFVADSNGLNGKVKIRMEEPAQRISPKVVIATRASTASSQPTLASGVKRKAAPDQAASTATNGRRKMKQDPIESVGSSPPTLNIDRVPNRILRRGLPFKASSPTPSPASRLGPATRSQVSTSVKR